LISSANFGNAYGTSFAAPQVAGTIAQLCSYNSALKYKQSAMGAILMASSWKKINVPPGTTRERGSVFAQADRIDENTQISDKEGAGILDARSARTIVSNGDFWSPVVYRESFPYSKTVTINASANTISRIAIFWLVNNRIPDSDPNHVSGSTISTNRHNLQLCVFGPDDQLIASSLAENSNFEVVQFVPEITGVYTIVITLSSNFGGEKLYIGIAGW